MAPSTGMGIPGLFNIVEFSADIQLFQVVCFSQFPVGGMIQICNPGAGKNIAAIRTRQGIVHQRCSVRGDNGLKRRFVVENVYDSFR